MEKGQNLSQIELNQPSPGVSKETGTDNYSTCREDIAEMAIAAIQPCPIIPDYKEPSVSALPIIVQTPAASFCIDGWHFIEQAKADNRSTIRCHIFHIAHHSDTELAIRKAAIRVMPQGGKCSYAELVRNTHRIYRALQDTSDDLVLFSHGGDRRGVGFNSCRENNIRIVLAHRLGKSQTTINKYLQHGDSLNESAMESLVDAVVPKLFFEAIQVQKQVEIARLRSQQKNEAAIVAVISDQVSTWFNESQQSDPPETKTPASPQSPKARQPAGATRPHIPSGNRCPTPRQRVRQAGSGTNDSPVIDPTPTDQEIAAAELKRIGEALIEIADGQERPTPQQVETIRGLIIELSTLLQCLTRIGAREGDGNGGAV